MVSKIAYSDWSRGGDYSRSLTQHATKLVQRNLTPGGDKNGADINLALDALEMAFTHPHINAYVIVGGDSDFITLVEKLKQYDKQIFVVGGRSFTSYVMQRNCHEFIAYENLIGSPSGNRRRPRRPVSRAGGRAGADRAGRAAGAARAEDPQRPRSIAAAGAAQEHAAAARLDLLGADLRRQQLPRLRRQARGRRPRHRSRDGPQRGRRADRERRRPSAGGRTGGVADRRRGRATDGTAGRRRAGGSAAATAAVASRRLPGHRPVRRAQEPRVAEAVAEVRRLFQSAQQPPRWPMYVRQAKQFMRNVDSHVRRTEVRLRQHRRPAPRGSARGAVPDRA